MTTIFSWNVNSVAARWPRVESFLKRVQPDVVCLQEVKCVDEKFPTEKFADLGYHSCVFGQKTYNGVAILSRTPLSDIERGMGDRIGDDARLIAATTAGVRVISAYIPNGKSVGSESYQYKLEWLARLKLYCHRKVDLTKPAVLAGDFNVAPTDDDCYDPDLFRGGILFSEPEKAALKDVVSLGWQDTLRLKHPGEKIYSWWDYRELGFPKNKGLRIDFVFASPPFMEVCEAAWVEREERKGEKPSDHAPVGARFGDRHPERSEGSPATLNKSEDPSLRSG